MKRLTAFALAPLLLASTLCSLAQQVSMPKPSLDGSLAKLFGDNTEFTAKLEISADQGGGHQMTMPGKMEFSHGKSRFDLDMSDIKGAQLPPDAKAQMKQMGMSRVINITVPEKKAVYMIYPDASGYMEMHPASAGTTANDFKATVTEIGTESIDGHKCVKNKVVVTGPDGVAHQSTVWNAKDLKQFPVRIEMAGHGSDVVMVFKSIKLSAPDEADFEVPAGYKQYADVVSMMMSRVPH